MNRATKFYDRLDEVVSDMLRSMPMSDAKAIADAAEEGQKFPGMFNIYLLHRIECITYELEVLRHHVRCVAKTTEACDPDCPYMHDDDNKGEEDDKGS